MDHSVQLTKSSSNQIDTIVTNWIREVKEQSSEQPLPTSAYGYGEGGAGYDVYSSHYNGVHHTPMQRSNGPPTKKLKSLMDIEIPTPSNVSSQNKSNVPATADPYNSYEQYRNYMEKGYTEPSGTLDHNNENCNNHGMAYNTYDGSFNSGSSSGWVRRPLSGWATKNKRNLTGCVQSSSNVEDIAPPGIDIPYENQHTEITDKDVSFESPFDAAFRKMSKEKKTIEKAHKKISQSQSSAGKKRPLSGFTIENGFTDRMLTGTESREDIITEIQEKVLRRGRTHPEELQTRLAGYPRKDDNIIKTDKIIINKHWNFWDLPSKAKVLLISNLPSTIAHPSALFHIFSLYGDVLRTKVFNKENTKGFVEYSTATFAMIAKNVLDQCEIHDQKVCVSFSKFSQIESGKDCGNMDEGNMKCFERNEYVKYRRFRTEELMRINLKTSVKKPTSTLVAFNFPANMSGNTIKTIFDKGGVKIVSILPLRASVLTCLRWQDRILQNSENNLDDTRKLLLQFSSAADAIIALGIITGHSDLGEMLLYFSQHSVEDTKARIENSTAFFYEILPEEKAFNWDYC